ncbi:Sugar phosphate permease [Natronincola peptidivorans]|uniref:Sugar phosphate permease n=1 Tax=Natronincola peptidivorans TaxID=426128 RepID=A0A1I0GAZ2_9FIRM|nr:MFS transporter [Natronincola peptidivorans]SET67301.1 Sugar phosphate permease [Natronincola peptidivorans]
MQVKTLNKPSYRKTSLDYGWLIVALAALGLFFSGPGQTYSVSIFINSYIETFGWSRSLVSSFYSAGTLIAGFLLPLIGKVIDKKGHRKMFICIATLLGIACLWMSFVRHPLMLLVGFLFLRLFGQGSMSLLPATLVPQWFIRKRGVALSLMALGGVLGSAAIPPLNNWLILQFGTAIAWRVWTFLLIGFMAPISWVFIRNKPEDIGLLPDGEVIGTKEALTDAEREKQPLDFSWSTQEAMKTRAFWLMLFCMVVPSMVNTGITFHMVSIMEGKGFNSTFAASLLGLTAIIQFPFTFLAGYLADRIKVHYIKAINFIVFLIAIGVILYGSSKELLMAYAVFNGVFVAFDSVTTGVLWPNYFGRKHLGSIRGIAMTAMVVGSALGPLPFGFAYDILGGYKEILLLMMIFPILAAIASIVSPPPKYQD